MRGFCQTKNAGRAFRQSQGAGPAQVGWRSQEAEGQGIPLRVRLQPGLYPRGICKAHMLDSGSCPGETEGLGSSSGADRQAGRGDGTVTMEVSGQEPGALSQPRCGFVLSPGAFVGRMGTFIHCWEDSGLDSGKPLRQKKAEE